MKAVVVISLLIALALFTLSAATAQNDIKWNQPPDPINPGNLFYGWNEPSQYGGPQIAADDWVCTSPDPVTDIHWWGSYLNWNKGELPPIQPDAFRVTIWTDVPQGPNVPFSHPGRVVWEGQFTLLEVNQNFVGWDYDPRTQSFEACFRYDLILPQDKWFYQNPEPPENIYWISIAPVYLQGTGEHPWGWKTRPRDPQSPAPDAAVRVFAPTAPVIGSPYQQGEPIYWPDPEKQWDLAFELTTQSTGIKWEQTPNPELPGLHCHDYFIDPGVQWTKIAEDWKCAGGVVTDFHWWGNYEMGVLGEQRGSGIKYFHLSIHPDAGGMPGPEIWGYDAFGVAEIPTGLINNEGSPIYRYDFVLPQPFVQEQGKIYWFDLTAYSNDPKNPALWRWQEWKRSPLPLVTLAPAMQCGPVGIWQPIFWQQTNTYSEMAYRVTSEASGIQIKWSQPPEPYNPSAYNGWNELSMHRQQQIVADDWACTTQKPVTDVHWWGSFINWSQEAPPQMPDAFHIAIWTDVPAGVDKWFSHPGRCIWETVCSDFTWQFVGWDIDPRNPNAPPEACYKFDQFLKQEEWFWQASGNNIYWISIAAIYGNPPAYPWGWKTRPRNAESPAPDDAVRIFDPTSPSVGSLYNNGQPIFWPTEKESWDTAFVLTTTQLPVGSLTVKYNQMIPNHFWYPTPDIHNEMISLQLSADPTEPIKWDTLTLQSYGTGNDATDITAIRVWLDNNNNAVVDAGDTMVGSGTYPADNGMVTISLAAPPVIPAGGFVNALISYTMAAPLPGRTYQFNVTAVTGTGQISLMPVPVTLLPNPLVSARKKVGKVPITIGQAKLPPVGSTVFLEDKEVTAVFTAPGWPVPWNWVYIEEPDRSAGIGIINSLGGTYNVGERVTLLATTTLINSAELMLVPDEIMKGLTPGTVIPVGMMNRSTGGGVFGMQPGVIDDVSSMVPKPSYGLNNVGMLIRTWGRVTGYGGVTLGGGSWVDVTWIDDGTNLHDGYTTTAGDMSTGIAVVTPSGVSTPMTGYWGITGILRSIQNPIGQPVRLLVPRDLANDCMNYAP